jgi:hypothetical protein
MTCKRREPTFIQLSGTQAMPIKPAVQVSKKPELLSGVDPAVALFEKEPSKPVGVARQWATSETVDGAWVLEKPRCHTSSYECHQPVGCSPIILMALSPFGCHCRGI